MDTLARLYGGRLSQSLGRAVVIDNRRALLDVGANASRPRRPMAIRSWFTSSAMAINLVLFKQVNYDPERDFVPVALT